MADELVDLGLAEPIDGTPDTQAVPDTPLDPTTPAQPNPAAQPSATPTQVDDELVGLGLAEPIDASLQPDMPADFNEATRLGQGAVKGLSTMAPTVAGMYYGGRLGLGVGAAIGTAVPVIGTTIGGVSGAILGGAAGGAIGFLIGDQTNHLLARVTLPGTDEPLTYESAEAIPLEQRPWFNAGETTVGALSFMVPVYGLAANGVRVGVNAARAWYYPPNLFANAINGIIRGAEKNPYWFAFGEANMAALSGAGAFTAETLYPGETLPRLGFEMGFPLATLPGRALLFAATTSWRLGKQMLLASSEDAQKNALGGHIRDLIKAYGEDPADIIAKLADNADELAALKQTIGMRSQSPAMQALDAAIASEDHRFGTHMRQTADAAHTYIEAMIKDLAGSGQPEAMRLAAQLRETNIEGRILARFQAARSEALRAAAEIDPSNAKDLAAYGTRADTILASALDDVERVEADLWSKLEPLAKGTPASIDNVTESVSVLRNQRVKGTSDQNMPKVVEEFLSLPQQIEEAKAQVASLVVKNEPVPAALADMANRVIDVADLITLRQRMTTLARQASAGEAPNLTDAHVYSQIAKAVLEDIRAADDETTGAFAEAIAWSTKKFEFFNHTFAGKLGRTTRGGAEVLDPTMAMREAFSSVSEKAQLNFRQLSEAAALGDEAKAALQEGGTHAMDAAQAAATQHVTEMLAVQEHTLRFAAASVVDRGTGLADPARLAAFRHKYGNLLDQFPNLRDGLASVERANQLFQSAQTGQAAARQAMRESRAFQAVLGSEDPAAAVKRVLSGENPVMDLRYLVAGAKRSSAAATEGLKAAVFNYLYDSAVNAAGVFSPARYKQAFEGPMTPGGPMLKEVLIQSGLIPRGHAERTTALLGRMADVESAVSGQAPAQHVFGEGDAVLEATLKLLGVRLAKMVPEPLKGHDLAVAAIASKFTRQVLDKMPTDKMKSFLVEALKDGTGQTMKALLERGTTPRMKLDNAFQLNGALWRAGVGGLESDNTQ